MQYSTRNRDDYKSAEIIVQKLSIVILLLVSDLIGYPIASYIVLER